MNVEHTGVTFCEDLGTKIKIIKEICKILRTTVEKNTTVVSLMCDQILQTKIFQDCLQTVVFEKSL